MQIINKLLTWVWYESTTIFTTELFKELIIALQNKEVLNKLLAITINQFEHKIVPHLNYPKETSLQDILQQNLMIWLIYYNKTNSIGLQQLILIKLKRNSKPLIGSITIVNSIIISHCSYYYYAQQSFESYKCHRNYLQLFARTINFFFPRWKNFITI